MCPFIADFRRPQNAEDLATVIGCPSEMLDKILRSATRREFYTEYRIPKRNRHRKGEYRVVWKATSFNLVQVQKTVLRKFEDFSHESVDGYPHPAVHGYTTGRSTLTNAKCHVGAKVIVRADIKDFFPTISRARLEALFVELGLRQSVAEVMGGLATISNELGQGIHTSPLFANLVCIPLDQDLSELAKEHQATYTRYADDLVFSSNTQVPSKIAIESVLQKYGFELAHSKFRRTKIGQAHFVTGLSVSDADRPRVPYKFKHKLRQELYYSDRFGIRDHAGKAGYRSYDSCVNSIDGRISYVQGIEHELGTKMRRLWTDLLERDGLFPTYRGLQFQRLREVSCFIDETVMRFGGDTYFGLALVVTEDANTIEETIRNTLGQLLGDPYTSGRLTKLQKWGFHFTDDSQEVRTEFIKTIARFPIRAFIAYRKLTEITEKDAYISLLGRLVRNRLARFQNLSCTIVYEQNPVVSESDFRAAIGDVTEELTKLGRPPHQEIHTVRGGKVDQPCLAIADYLLGVFSNYATSDTTDETPVKRFERLRDKIRLIVDVDNEEHYWRNNRFTGFASTQVS